MNLNCKFLFLFVLSLLFSVNIYSQDRVVHGIITTFDSIPLIGASVKVLSTKQIVLSDSLGKFSIKCLQEDKIKITAEGFYNQKVKLDGKIKIAAINLKLKPVDKKQEYNIGYGHISEENKSNAVEGLTMNKTDFSRYSDIYNLIAAQFAGVQIVNGEIVIRGAAKSINSSSAALIVVDGVMSDQSILSTVRPIDVKSINVIKDGSSAVYGTRGVNGVVIIETKKGGDD